MTNENKAEETKTNAKVDLEETMKENAKVDIKETMKEIEPVLKLLSTIGSPWKMFLRIACIQATAEKARDQFLSRVTEISPELYEETVLGFKRAIKAESKLKKEE